MAISQHETEMVLVEAKNFEESKKKATKGTTHAYVAGVYKVTIDKTF